MIINCGTPDTLYNKFTDWESFREYIESNIDLKKLLKTPENIDNVTKYITLLIQEWCWKNTSTIDNIVRSENQLLVIKQKVLEKLRRVWHQSKLNEDKIRFDKPPRN